MQKAELSRTGAIGSLRSSLSRALRSLAHWRGRAAHWRALYCQLEQRHGALLEVEARTDQAGHDNDKAARKRIDAAELTALEWIRKHEAVTAELVKAKESEKVQAEVLTDVRKGLAALALCVRSGDVALSVRQELTRLRDMIPFYDEGPIPACDGRLTPKPGYLATATFCNKPAGHDGEHEWSSNRASG